MKKKKVLIVHNYYQIPGGEDTVVENEKELLLDNGHQVVLYTRHNNEIKSRGILGKLMLPLDSIFSIKTYKEVKEIIKKEKIDIVHVHNTLPLVSPSVYYAAINNKVPVVQSVHNFRMLCPGATFTKENKICEDCVDKGLICAVKNKCYRGSLVQSIVSVATLVFHRLIGTYRKVSGYIALTEFNKNKLKTLISEEKIYVKPNFINKNKDTLIRGSYKDYFLFLGRIDELKGINLLIETWRGIDDSKLKVVGTGPLEENIKEYIDRNSINNVELLGFKKKEDVMKLIKNAKALIVPSQWYEGFPMTIVESLSLGIPIIAGDIGNMATIIKNGYNGLLFKYDDKNELKEKILEIDSDIMLLEHLRNGALETYNKKYNEDINYKLLKSIYDECSRRH